MTELAAAPRRDIAVSALLATARLQLQQLEAEAAALSALVPAANDAGGTGGTEREALTVLRRELPVRLAPALARALPGALELKALSGGITYAELGDAFAAHAAQLDSFDAAAAAKGAKPALRRFFGMRHRLRLKRDLDKLRQALALADRAVTDAYTARAAQAVDAQAAQLALQPALAAVAAVQAGVERLKRLDDGQRFGIAQTRLRPVAGAVLSLPAALLDADDRITDWTALTRLADLATRPVFLRHAEWVQPSVSATDGDAAARQPMLELYALQEVDRDLLAAPAGAFAVVLRSRQGVLQQRSFGSADAAVEAFEAALALDPTAQDWPEVEGLDSNLGAWREHVGCYTETLPQGRPELLQRRLYAVEATPPNLPLLNRMRALEDLPPLAEGETVYELRLVELTLAGNPQAPGGCCRDERPAAWTYTGAAADTMAKAMAMIADGDWRMAGPALGATAQPAAMAVAV